MAYGINAALLNKHFPHFGNAETYLGLLYIAVLRLSFFKRATITTDVFKRISHNVIYGREIIETDDTEIREKTPRVRLTGRRRIIYDYGPTNELTIVDWDRTTSKKLGVYFTRVYETLFERWRLLHENETFEIQRRKTPRKTKSLRTKNFFKQDTRNIYV